MYGCGNGNPEQDITPKSFFKDMELKLKANLTASQWTTLTADMRKVLQGNIKQKSMDQIKL